jgi:hypothetical protein
MPVLAQMNIARMALGWDDPEFADFREALGPVNREAERHPGFVWRLRDSKFDSPELVAFENEGWLVNLTAWRSIEQLRAFVRSPGHLAIMRRRAEWFTPVETHLVLWWLPDDRRPRFRDGMERLERLRREGPGPGAFDFRHPHPPSVPPPGAE